MSQERRHNSSQGRRSVSPLKVSKVSNKARPGNALPLSIRTLLAAYVATIILLSYQPGLTLFGKIVGGVIGLAFLFFALAKEVRIQVPTTYKLFAIWFLLALLGAFQANEPVLALSRALTLVQVVPLAFVLTVFLVWNRRSEFYWLALIGAGILGAAVVWIRPDQFIGIDGRVYGTLGNANAFGTMLAVGASLCVVYALTARKLLARVLAIGLAVTFFIVVTTTGSRQALIGALLGPFSAGVGYLFHLGRQGKASFVPMLMLIAAGLVGATIYVAQTDFWFRMESALNVLETGQTVGADASLKNRMWLYKKSLETAISHPVFGVGLDNFRTVSRTGLGSSVGTYAHSNYMEIMSTTGLLGFVAYFLIYVHWASTLWSSREALFDSKQFRTYLRCTTVIAIIWLSDLTSVSYYEKYYWLIFAVLVADLEFLSYQKNWVNAQRVHA